MLKTFFTSESVTEGHPDKICDQIADSILDSILAKDENARVACEVTATTGIINIMGEITTNIYVDFAQIARQKLIDIGYSDTSIGFDGNTCAIVCNVQEQSPDIAQGVDCCLESKENKCDKSDTGAGDQGMMFGFACDETPELMPMPISLAHKLSRRLAVARKTREISYLRPDGKTQVTIEYHDKVPARVDSIVISAQHNPDIDMDTLKSDIINKVIFDTIGENLIDANTKFFINPTGRFVIGGPCGDTGLTGRKIIADTYGGYARHGGGAFSGKDATKVDRSAAYMARYVAKNIVSAGLASKCEIQIGYAIGIAKPISLAIETFGTNTLPEDEIIKRIEKVFDLRPSAIIQKLQLRKPIFSQTSVYGHFGRSDLDLPWEKPDMADLLKTNTIF